MKILRNSCRALLFSILLITCFLPLGGCGTKDPILGFYAADYAAARNDIDLTYTPWICLRADSEEFGPWGTIAYGPGQIILVQYTIEGNILVMDSLNSDGIYYFEIIDKKTLKYANANESAYDLHDFRLERGIQIGDVFHWAEGLPEE